MSSTAHPWRLPAGLIALGLIPIVFGSLRVVELLGGPATMPVQARFADSPVPVVLHIVSAIPYLVLGAFQFSASLRRRRPAAGDDDARRSEGRCLYEVAAREAARLVRHGHLAGAVRISS
jgi:hypothetical protein